MRSDIHKVVVERPRWTPGPGKQQRRANLPEEQLPKYEGIQRAQAKRKRFTDLLGPLKRWLRSQVGRPWDLVYSEACEVVQPDSIIRAHIKTHLLQFVERHTFIHEGQICFLDTACGRFLPITAPHYRGTLFYVHPKTCLLCALPQKARPRQRFPDREKRARVLRWIDRNTVLRLVKGCWFECRVEAFPISLAKGENPCRFDLVEHRLIRSQDALEIYGRDVHCVARHQLSRRELRAYGLSNQEPVEEKPSSTARLTKIRPVMVF